MSATSCRKMLALGLPALRPHQGAEDNAVGATSYCKMLALGLPALQHIRAQRAAGVTTGERHQLPHDAGFRVACAAAPSGRRGLLLALQVRATGCRKMRALRLPASQHCRVTAMAVATRGRW